MSLMPLGLLSQGGGAGNGGNALTLISTQVLASATSSVTFSSIPSTYKHLEIRVTTRSATAGGDNIRMQFNSDTAANYANHRLYGEGTTVTSAANTSFDGLSYLFTASAASPSNAFTGGIISIADYAQTTKNKTVRILGGGSYSSISIISLQSGAWFNTSAVSSIRFYLASADNFVIGSRFSLYGVS